MNKVAVIMEAYQIPVMQDAIDILKSFDIEVESILYRLT
jgi:phosphoribosylcarboxyaminoimidazole (NCAIR) mutase